MEFSLKGIIAIAGSPGLYKVIAQGHNNNVIVESLIDKKRKPAYATSKISALEDITMYSTGETDKPLHEIIKAIYDKENGGEYADAKDESKHAAYLKDVFADYDSERIYASDIRKLFSWYNLLQSSGELARIADEAANPKTEEEKEKPAEKKKEAKVVEKKPVEKKAAEKKPAVKEKKAEKKEDKKADKKEEKSDKKKTTEKKAVKKDSKTTVKKTAAKSKTAASSKAKSSVSKKSTGSKRGG